MHYIANKVNKQEDRQTRAETVSLPSNPRRRYNKEFAAVASSSTDQYAIKLHRVDKKTRH